jgi:hypothetical protein
VPHNVVWRTRGHTLNPEDQLDLLRFEVEDLNQVMKNAAAAASAYRSVVEQGGRSTGALVLPLSCFAVTEYWTPEKLLEGQRYKSYRLGTASVLIANGFEVWPTELYLDGQPDYRNEVHYDVVVAEITAAHLTALASGRAAERAAIRDELRPRFEALHALLSEPHTFRNDT